MDPRIEQWQRQAQAAINQRPEKKDAIEAKLAEMINDMPHTWAKEAQAAVDSKTFKTHEDSEAFRKKVVDRYESTLTEHFPDFAFKDDEGKAVKPDFSDWFKQGRGEDFAGKIAAGVSTFDKGATESRLAEQSVRDAANRASGSDVPAPNVLTQQDQNFLRSQQAPTERSLMDNLTDVSRATGDSTVAGLEDAKVKLLEAGAGANILFGQDAMAETMFPAIEEATRNAAARRASAAEDSTLGSIAGEVVGGLAPVSVLSRVGAVEKQGSAAVEKTLNYIKEQLPAGFALANIQADSLARNAIEKGASEEEVMKLLLTGTATNTAANLLPVAAKGGLAKRILTGAALGAGGNLAADAALGEISKYAPGASIEGTLAGGGMGAVFGVAGPKGTGRIENPTPDTSRIGTEDILPPEEARLPDIDTGRLGPISREELRSDHAANAISIDPNAGYSQGFNLPERNTNFGSQPETTVGATDIQSAPTPRDTGKPRAVFNEETGQWEAKPIEDVPFELPPQAGGADVTVLPPREEFSVKSPDPLEGDVSATVSPAPLDGPTKSPVSTFKYNLDKDGVAQPTLTQKAKAKSETVSVADLKKQLESAEGEQVLLSAAQVGGEKLIRSVAPEHIMDKLRKGELTTRDILEETSRVVPSDPSAKQEAAQLANYLKALSDSIGGEDVRFTYLDDANPEHAELMRTDPNLQGGDFAAFYNPRTNQIYMKKSTTGLRTMLHEAAHGIASKMLFLGREGKLSGQAQASFTNMHNTFENLIKPELAKRAAELPEGSFLRKTKEYGLTNIDEFYSEFFSNGVFRQSLKDMKLTPELMAGLDTRQFGLAYKARTLYDVAVKGISTLMAKAGLKSYKDLGLADKAESAYEAMFANMDKLHNSLSKTEKAALKDFSTRNTKEPDMGFLGEQAPPRSMPAAPEGGDTLQPARNKYLAGAKGLFAGRGVQPLVTKTKEFLSGSKKATRQEDIANTNKATSILSKVGPTTRAKIRELQEVIHADMSTPAAGKALAELRELNPEMAALTQKLALDSRNNSLDLMREAIRSQEGQLTPDPKVLAMAAKYYENRNKYSPVIYDSAEATKRRTKSAKLAEKKLADGKLLSKEEQQDLQAWNNLKSWIKDTTFGDVATLSKETYPSIRTIFDSKFGTGALKDKGYDQLPKEARKQAMIEDIAQENSKIENLDKAINNMADSIAGIDQGNGKVLDYFNGLKYSKDVFKSLTQVPEPIRKYWGEVSDPLLKMIEANTRQKLQLAEIKGLNELREQGMGTLFTDRKDTDMNAVLDGPGYGALQGLHTTPDIKKALGDIKDFNGQAAGVIDSIISGRDLNTTTLGLANKALLRWTQLTRAVKTNVTIGNLGAWWRNAEGSVLQAMSNGNSDTNTYKQGLRAMKGLVGISGKTEVNPDSLLMAKLDLAEASQTTDTYSPRNKKAKDELRRLLDEHPEADTPGKIRKVMDAGGYGVDVAKEMYGALDLWTKFANFYNDRNKWKAFNERNGIKMSDEELDRFVADRTKQTNISYSRSPKALKIADALGGTQFANYYWEVFRTSLNNVQTGISDIRTAAKHGDWQMFQHGADRLAGTSMAVYGGTQLYTSIIKGTAAMLGFTAAAEGDDKAVKEYRKDTSFFDPESTVDFKDPETGAVYGFDTSMISPYDPATKMLVPALKAMQDPKNAEKYLKEMGENAVDLFNRTPLIAQVGKVLRGATPSLAKSDPETYAWLQELGVGDAGLEPKTVDRLINTAQPFVLKAIREGLRGANTEGEGRTKKAIASGIGVYELNPQKDVENYLGQGFKYDLKDAKDKYKTLATSNVPLTEGRLEEGFVDAMKAMAKPYGKMEKALAAHKAMGKEGDDILAIMIDKGMDRDTAVMLQEGKASPALIVYDDLLTTAQEAYAAAPEDKKAAVLTQWEKKLKLLEDIALKYENTSFKDLE